MGVEVLCDGPGLFFEPCWFLNIPIHPRWRKWKAESRTNIFIWKSGSANVSTDTQAIN